MAKSRISKIREKSSENKKKRQAKKLDIAKQTLVTWSNLGYADTSLRDIAEHCNVSVGVLLYYFEDKAELITYCVQLYKENFIKRMDTVLETDGDPEHILKSFTEKIITSVKEEGNLHRLWYDIRSQALFDPEFQEVVDELEKAMIQLNGRLLKRIQLKGIDPFDYYLNVDTRFRFFLQQYIAGDDDAPANLRKSLRKMYKSFRIISNAAK